MNERQDSSAVEEHDASAATDAHPGSSDQEESGMGEMTTSRRERRSGRGLILFALLLAAVSLGLSGWQWWQARQAAQASPQGEILEQLDDLGERVQGLERRLGDVEALSGRLDTLQGRLEELSARIESVQSSSGAESSELQSLADTSETLDARLSELERSLPEQLAALREAMSSNRQRQAVALDERVEERRREMMLLELAGLLRLGQAHAELSGDISGARAAYAQASGRLQTLEDAGLDRLRSLLAAERESLEQLSPPDWVQIGTRLARLDARAGGWPVAGRAGEISGQLEQESPGQSNDWWQGMRRALGGLVRVSERDRAILPESAIESVRERVRLHLAAARAAVARRNAAELSQQVASVTELLEAHFDTRDAGVVRAMESLKRLAEIEEPEIPELGDALAEIERRLAAS